MSLPISPAPTVPDAAPGLRNLWWLFLAFGLVLVLIGILAVSSAFVATLVSVVFFGVLLLIAGGTEVIYALTLIVGRQPGIGIHLLSAALYLLVGVFMLEDPVRAATVITLLLVASFLVGGVLRIVTAVAERFPAWPWAVLTGVVDLVLGVMIASGWPESSLWVVGLFVGIDLIFHGLSWVVLALTVRTLTTSPGIAA
jgi:uncharacterized membrane protein HdeD (DUF308 family)